MCTQIWECKKKPELQIFGIEISKLNISSQKIAITETTKSRQTFGYGADGFSC